MDYLKTREMYHHGIKGQRWGIRKYQNPDGTLTAEGRARYGIDEKDNASNRLLRSSDTNRKDAGELRKAAILAKTEKARKDLLDSADALEKLAEKQEALAKMSKDGKKLYKQDKRDQKILDRSNAANALAKAGKIGANYFATEVLVAFAGTGLSKLMKSQSAADAVIKGTNFVNKTLSGVASIHMIVGAVQGANEKDKIRESQK